jgi:hypothetical protein
MGRNPVTALSGTEVAGRGIKRADFISAALVTVFIAITAHGYFAKALGGEWIQGDARQQVWTIWTLLDVTRFAPDFFSTYITDKTMPHAFVWLVRHVAALVGAPEPVFAWIGVISLLVTAYLAWQCGRSIGGAAASWAALALVFSVDVIAERTVGGLPRALGMPIVFLAALGLVSARPLLTGAASVLGGIFWYPAALMAGGLFALQMLLPARLFGPLPSASWGRRAAIVAMVGIATAIPVVPEVLGTGSYGHLITAHDAAWPEAGTGGRFDDDQLLGAPHPGGMLLRRAASPLTNLVGSWRPRSELWNHLTRGMSFVLIAGITGLLVLRSRRDVIARRLLAIAGMGLLCFLAAIALAPYAYIPERYLTYLWVAYAIASVPYALVLLASRIFPVKTQPVAVWSVVGVGTAAIVLLIGGRLTTQGLGVHLNPTQRAALAQLERSANGSLVAGWPTGIVNDVPYFAHRSVLLSFELHLPWHEVVARETRRRMEAIVAAWYSADPENLDLLNQRYGVQYFVIDKEFLPRAAYFAPFDKSIEAQELKLGGRLPYVSNPEQSCVVFDNANYRILALGRTNGC